MLNIYVGSTKKINLRKLVILNNIFFFIMLIFWLLIKNTVSFQTFSKHHFYVAFNLNLECLIHY